MMSARQERPSFGARVEDDGVRFHLWAPAQREITLLLDSTDGQHGLPMEELDGGWLECFSPGARAGDRYCYLLPDGLRVPDPASRFQPDDVHGTSEVIAADSHRWEHSAWRGRAWREAVVYEAHVGTFGASGDYAGMRERLAHLAHVGFTALELMPLADFEGRRNWGYDGALPFAPDSSYGRPEDLQTLVDVAHGHGLMVLLDVVYNHFGPSGNYLGRYAPQFFTDKRHTPWGAAIDFSRPEVRQFFIENALCWLEEYRFDGLRLDAVDAICDDSSPHFLAELATTVRERLPDRHVHLVLENDDNCASWLERSDCTQAGSSESSRVVGRYTAQWNDDYHHAAHVLATGETSGYYADYAHQPTAALGRALAQGFVFQGDYSSYRDRIRGQPSTALPPLAFVNFLQNHDQIGNRASGERLCRLASADAISALTAVHLLAPAIPLLFMGEEWNATQPFLYFCDYHDELADVVRSGRHREFGKFAAFADTQAQERIPDPNAEATSGP